MTDIMVSSGGAVSATGDAIAPITADNDAKIGNMAIIGGGRSSPINAVLESSATAGSTAWISTSWGDWNDPSNWSKGVPTDAVDAVLSNLNPVFYRVTLTANGTANSLNLSYYTVTLYVDSTSANTSVNLSIENNLQNSGTVWIDVESGTGWNGGSTVSIGGALINTGYFLIGTATLSAAAMVTAATMTNSGNSGISIIGGSGATAPLASLDITAEDASLAQLGTIYLSGHALLEFSSGSVSSIASYTTVTLVGSNAFIANASQLTSNSALSGLADNAGSLRLESGAYVQTQKDLTNGGQLWVDLYGGGGSTLAIEGALNNVGSASFGSQNNTAPTLVTASNFSNTKGTLGLAGGATTAAWAIFDITSSAPSQLMGSISLSGRAILGFTDGSISSNNGNLSLFGPNAYIADASDTTSNSALSVLADNTNVLDLESGAELNVNGDFANNGTIYIDSYISTAGSGFGVAGTLTNNNYLDVGTSNASATLKSAVSVGSLTNTFNVTIQASGTLLDDGSYNQMAGSTTVAGKLMASLINITAGSLSFNAALSSGAGPIDMSGAGTVVEFGSAVPTGQTVDFLAPSGAVRLDDLAEFGGTIGGLAVGNSAAPTNKISLTKIGSSNIQSASLNRSTDAISVTTTSSTFAIQLSGMYAAGTFVNWLPGAGGVGSDLFLSNVACFCRGTAILTDIGEQQIEGLRIGDRVVTLSGDLRPVKWVGRRTYGVAFIAGNRTVLPIHIRAGALGNGLPRRDLWVSPHHALFIDGALVMARLLINGTSIVQADRVESLEYFHIELETHDVILAEGAPAETYVERANRGMFHNAAEFTTLHAGRAGEELPFCAPRLEAGASELRRIRASIADRLITNAA